MGTKYESTGGGATTLDGLTDVTITGTPADNEVLAYDTGTGEFINQTSAEAGLGTLNNIVEDTTPQLGGTLDCNTFDIDGLGILNFTGNETLTGSATQIARNSAVSNYLYINHPTSIYLSINAVATLRVQADKIRTPGVLDFINSGTTIAAAQRAVGWDSSDGNQAYNTPTGQTHDFTVNGVDQLVVGSSAVTLTPALNIQADSNQIVLDSDAGAGATTTITDSATAARVLTLPDATDTLIGKATTDTLTNKTIDTASNTITVVEADISDLGAYITAVVDDLTPQLANDLDTGGNLITGFANGSFLGDVNSNELLRFNYVASAANYINITNSATGTTPIVAASGSDTNVDLTLDAKGTGEIVADAPLKTLEGLRGSLAIQTGGVSANNDGAVGYNDYGLFSDTSTTSTGASTGSLGVDSGGAYKIVTSNTGTANSAVGIRSDQATIAMDALPDIWFKFAMTTTTSYRFFVGLSEGSLVACQADSPVEDYIGVQFSTNRADTNFQFMHRDTAQTIVDSGVAANTSTHYLHIRADSASSVVMALYDSTGALEGSTTVTTEIPANDLLIQICAEQLSTTNEGYKLYFIQGGMRGA